MCFAVLLSSQPRCSKWEDGESWAAPVSLLQLANSRACSLQHTEHRKNTNSFSNWNIHWDVGTVQTLKDAPSGHLSLPMTALHSGMGMAFHPVKSSCLSPFFVSSQDPVRPDLCSCSFVMEEKIKNNKKKALCFLYCYFLQVHRGDNLFCSAMQNFTNLNWPDYLSNCIIVSTTES